MPICDTAAMRRYLAPSAITEGSLLKIDANHRGSAQDKAERLALQEGFEQMNENHFQPRFVPAHGFLHEDAVDQLAKSAFLTFNSDHVLDGGSARRGG